jgi:hypothetical protein
MKPANKRSCSVQLSAQAYEFVPGAVSHGSHLYKVTSIENALVTQSRVQSAADSDSKDDTKLIRSRAIHKCTLVRPGLSSFFPSIMQEFLEPVWSSVSVDARSCPSILPEVCALPPVALSASFSEVSLNGCYFLCRTFSGKWTLVDSCHIKDSSVKIRPVPERICRLLRELNGFQPKGSVHVLLCPSTQSIWITDVDWCRDEIHVYRFTSECALRSDTIIKNLPPGAVHVYGITVTKHLILSIGTNIAVISTTNPSDRKFVWNSLIRQPENTPVSTQLVVPHLFNDRVCHLSNGEVWLSALTSSEKRCIVRKSQIKYVSLSLELKSQTIVAVGYHGHRQYLTLIDSNAHFEMSTTEITCDGIVLSIVSAVVDPVNLNTVIIGRSSGRSNMGALCVSFPPEYN